MKQALINALVIMTPVFLMMIATIVEDLQKNKDPRG